MYPLHRWQALADLTSKERTALATLSEGEMTFPGRKVIRQAEEKVSGFYLLMSGWVISSVLLPSGAQVIQKVHLPGDMLGTPSMALHRAADMLTAVTEARVAFVPSERLGGSSRACHASRHCFRSRSRWSGWP